MRIFFRLSLLSSALLVIAGLHAPSALGADACELASFSPQGEVKDVRQVKAVFTDAMVAFGDPDATVAPFDIACSEAGQGRWVDTKTWVYDFARDLPAGVNCRFTARSDLACKSGSPYTGQTEFNFSTGGPTILDSTPYGYDVPEDAAMLLRLNGPVDLDSVLQNAYFKVPGIASRVGFKFITGKLRDDILEQYFQYREKPTKEELDSIIVIQPERRFPSGAKVELVWGPGIRTRGGAARADAQVWNYEIRPAFTATFSCERENAKAPCIAVANMRLQFSESVDVELARQVTLVGPNGQVWSEKYDETSDRVYSVTFKPPFPPDSQFKVLLPQNFQDSTGRHLVNKKSFPLKVATGTLPPLIKFSGQFGILEARANPILPITVRSVESVLEPTVYEPGAKEGGVWGKVDQYLERMKARFLKIPAGDAAELMGWLHRVNTVKRDESIFKPFENGTDFEKAPLEPIKSDMLKQRKIPRTNGKSDFEVIGMPFAEPGFYVVEVASLDLGKALLAKDEKMYVHTTALVTNMAVHFKVGDESSLVWVTSLDAGEPVEDALVSIWDCQGKVYWKGQTGKGGYALIKEADLPSPSEAPTCQADRYSSYTSGLMAVAEKSGDLTFAHTSWSDGIEPWRYNVDTGSYHPEFAAHTVFDRTLFKPGEKVHMKHVARRRSLAGFSFQAKGALPKKLVITHSATDEKWEFPLAWNESGSATSEWPIPPGAKLGYYETYVVLGDKDEWGDRVTTGNFRVEEYRVPLTRAKLQAPKGPLIAPKSVPFDLAVSYLSGGGASGLPVTFRSYAREGASIQFREFEDFVFAAGAVKAGVFRRGESQGESSGRRELMNEQATLDRNGTARVTVPTPRVKVPTTLQSELEYRDPNGEIQTIASNETLWPSDRLVGLKPKGWSLTKDDLQAAVAVTTLKGKPIAGAEVEVKLYRRQSFSHRKKLVGGFYAYDHTEKVEEIGSLCRGKTDVRGLFSCKGKTDASGQLTLEARLVAADGANTATNTSVWVAGSDDWWFEVEDHDRMDLVAERKYYEPGETARFQVRMPFRKAKALVTVEREGVAPDVRVVELSGKEPVIEVPVKGNFAPNVFVSVLAVRGRVEGPKPTALVDLAKPSFKLGLAEIKVAHQAQTLVVDVKTDKESYDVRGEVLATITAKPKIGRKERAPSEVALAVVDEGLLELKPNDSWRILEAMMGQRPYRVNTATASMQVVGKRHFGLKALPDGGGGGGEVTRSIFDALVHWEPRVKLGRDGRAQVRFKLNDSLTAFRVVAVATEGTDLFGTGQTTIRATQDVMVLAGLPPLARQGDHFVAGVTLRNTTMEPKTVTVTLSAPQLGAEFPVRTAELAPASSKAVGWNVMIPETIEGNVAYTLEVKGGQKTFDKIEITQVIKPAVPITTLQSTLVQVKGGMPETPVASPKGAIAGRSSVEVGLSPTLTASLTGVETYMADYPYACFEQRASVATALADEERWKKLMGELASYLDGDGLVKYFPTGLEGSETLTAYVLFLANETGWAIDEGPREQMLTGLKGYVEGRVRRTGPLQQPDIMARKLQALDAISRYETVSDELLASLEITPNLWPTSAVIDWYNVLGRNEALKDRDQRRAEAEQILKARLDLSGTELRFSTEQSDHLWWLMISPSTNALRLILSLVEFGEWRDDVPRLIKAALARMGKDGHWDLTTANAIGALTVRKFAKAYESEKVDGTTTARLAGESKSVDWSRVKASAQPTTLTLPMPEEGSLALTHQGDGEPWAAVASRAAVPLTEAKYRGLKISREVTAVEQKAAGAWHVGDVYRVKVKLEAQSDLTWVVVSDPIPTGATILGSGLGRDSARLTEGERSSGGAWPVFAERAQEAYRAYYDFVPKGEWTLEYTVRLNNAGDFHLPPAHVEAMYAPETHGDLPLASMKVEL